MYARLMLTAMSIAGFAIAAAPVARGAEAAAQLSVVTSTTDLYDIAKEVGLSMTMMGSYYKDKDALVVGCADRYHLHHQREAKRIIAGLLEGSRRYAIRPGRQN